MTLAITPEMATSTCVSFNGNRSSLELPFSMKKNGERVLSIAARSVCPAASRGDSEVNVRVKIRIGARERFMRSGIAMQLPLPPPTTGAGEPLAFECDRGNYRFAMSRIDQPGMSLH